MILSQVLRSTIPAKAICDELVHHYLRTFELIYRVIHIFSFLREYDRFWEDSESIPRTFLMKLVLILAIGTIFSPDRTNIDHAHRLIHTWIYAAQWWLAGPSERSTHNLDGLQVFCLLVIARQNHFLEDSVWLSTGSLMEIRYGDGPPPRSQNLPGFIRLSVTDATTTLGHRT
jgi:hypothetical protein